MSVVTDLSVLALGELVESACFTLSSGVGAGVAGRVVSLLKERLTDPSQRLVKALSQANVRAWRALEIALAGDSFWDRCRARLATGEERSFREQARAFLDTLPAEGLSANQEEFRRRCLDEVRAARKKGLLLGGTLSARQLAEQAGSLARFHEAGNMVRAQEDVLGRMAGELDEAGYSSLALLLEPRGGPSILVVAARYFFRRMVEDDPQLFQGLAFEQLGRLQEDQEHGFKGLHRLLMEQGDLLDRALQQVQETTEATHTAVLDVQVELQRQGEENRALYEAVLGLQERFDLMHREVRPRDSLSIRGEAERRLVKQVVGQYRALPEEQRQSLPALLNAVGGLEVAAGAFGVAERDFLALAGLVQDPAAQASAHHNAYRAALEARNWKAALRELLAATRLQPDLAPFPIERFPPERILGAGGCGVAFLCRFRDSARGVVVKTLLDTELGLGIEQLFTEAHVLRRLSHPGIVRLLECGYADPGTRARPYLVTEDFGGVTLEEFIRTGKPLDHRTLLEVARQMAEALGAAHAQGVLHRDVKPGNLLIKPAADRLQVQLIDFGVALRPQALQNTASWGTTLAGASITGTLDYASPEQLGRLPGVAPGPYSDVYGLAKTCCFALFATTQPVLKHWQGLPEPLANFLGRCLEESPTDRVPDCEAVLRMLDVVQEQASAPPTAVTTVPSTRGEAGVVPPAPSVRTRPRVRPAREEPAGFDWNRQMGGLPLWGWVGGAGVFMIAGLFLFVLVLLRERGPAAPPPDQSTGAIAGPTSGPLIPPDVVVNPSPPPAPDPGKQGEVPEAPVKKPTTSLPDWLRPAVVDPEEVRVYLSDLQEFDVQPSPAGWKYGKNGSLGNPDNTRLTVKGWESRKGLGMHPTTTYSGAKYHIEPAEYFQALAGIHESSQGSWQGLVFEVLGDGRVLWQSPPIKDANHWYDCRVLVRGVKVLELRVTPKGRTPFPPHGGHAAWLDPYITRPPKGSAD